MVKEVVFQTLDEHKNDKHYLSGFFDCLKIIHSETAASTQDEFVRKYCNDFLNELKQLRIERGI